jgi:MFS family permease
VTNDHATTLSPPWPRAFYYGWITLTVAALAMVGTLPGRTQGLGLITEPLLRDLGIDRVRFAEINLVATLIGSLFCLGVGRLVDRLGSRSVLTAISLALGATVIVMAQTSRVWLILVLITLTRGLGQSALSVASLAAVGKWFDRRLPAAMAAYTVIMSVGFMIAFPVVGTLTAARGWRVSWSAVGVALIAALAPLAWALVRSTPESCGLVVDGDGAALARRGFPAASVSAAGDADATLSGALKTPAFWVFALSAAVYGLVASGIALFNESILAERGFDAAIYYRSLVFTAMAALAGNFAAGGLAARTSLRPLLIASMVLLVVFFSFWGQTYGRSHLGRIQGAAQALTVLASAVGPLLLAWCVRSTGSYAAAFYTLSAVVVLLTVAAAVVHVPSRSSR